jgi:hypothetical protein
MYVCVYVCTCVCMYESVEECVCVCVGDSKGAADKQGKDAVEAYIKKHRCVCVCVCMYVCMTQVKCVSGDTKAASNQNHQRLTCVFYPYNTHSHTHTLSTE